MPLIRLLCLRSKDEKDYRRSVQVEREGAACVVCMISEDTDCHWTYHSSEPFTFVPDTEEQHSQVISLLEDFGLEYTEK